MFYCNACAEQRNWPKTIASSRGTCEICKMTNVVCNDYPSKDLPTGMDQTIKIEYLLGGGNPQTWEGTKKEAMQIALAEIHEHAGGSSPAYIFTKKVFDEMGLL